MPSRPTATWHHTMEDGPCVTLLMNMSNPRLKSHTVLSFLMEVTGTGPTVTTSQWVNMLYPLLVFCAVLCSTKVKYYVVPACLVVWAVTFVCDWVFTSHNVLFLNIWKDRELLKDPLWLQLLKEGLLSDKPLAQCGLDLYGSKIGRCREVAVIGS